MISPSMLISCSPLLVSPTWAVDSSFLSYTLLALLLGRWVSRTVVTARYRTHVASRLFSFNASNKGVFSAISPAKQDRDSGHLLAQLLVVRRPERRHAICPGL